VSSHQTARQLLLEIQRQQFSHDESFHREIARLPVARRLTHMALHISKYFSRAVRNEVEARPNPNPRNWIDTFIICTSIANILNVRLADYWEVDEDLPEARLRRWLTTKLEGRGPLLGEFAELNDILCSACEKLDHLEDHAYRLKIAAGACRLAMMAADRVYVQHNELFNPVTARLLETKRKNMFFEG